MFATVRTDPVSGRDQYRPVQQRGQTELVPKSAVLLWTVLVKTSLFLLMLHGSPPLLTSERAQIDNYAQYSMSFQSKWANLSHYKPDSCKFKPNPPCNEVQDQSRVSLNRSEELLD